MGHVHLREPAQTLLRDSLPVGKGDVDTRVSLGNRVPSADGGILMYASLSSDVYKDLLSR